MWKNWICLVCAGALVLVLAGCQKDTEEPNWGEPLAVASGFSFDTEDFTPPTQQNPKAQDLSGLYLQDLERPEALIYVVDGKARVFSAGDPGFEQILVLNTARDTVDSDGLPPLKLGTVRRNMVGMILDDDFLSHGRYLIYRYPAGGCGNLIFSLPKESEVDPGDVRPWTIPWVIQDGHPGGPYVCLSAADDLIACLEAK